MADLSIVAGKRMELLNHLIEALGLDVLPLSTKASPIQQQHLELQMLNALLERVEALESK